MRKKGLFFFFLVFVLFFSMGQQRNCTWEMPVIDGQIVTVCEESLLLPTELCPNLKAIWFESEDIPTALCEIHIKKLDHPAWELYAEFGRPIYLVPALLPSLLILKEISWEEHKAFIDRIIDENSGNALRAFGFGCWERHTIPLIRFPFKKVGGKFDLEQYDETWKMETFRRIKYFVDRGGTVIYSLIDACSMYPERDGHWKFHPWNGKNNINGTHEESKSVRHMYGWNAREIPGAKETKYYVLKFMRDMVRELEQRFPGAIVYDFNEFCGLSEWYLNVDRDVFQKFDIPKHRKMCSPIRIARKPNYKYIELPLIAARYIYQAHGIEDLDSYFNSYRLPSWLVHPSADGCSPVPYAMIKAIVMNSLFDGLCGFENNRIHVEGNVMDRVDWNAARGMKEAFLQWYNTQKGGEAWNTILKKHGKKLF